MSLGWLELSEITRKCFKSRPQTNRVGACREDAVGGPWAPLSHGHTRRTALHMADAENLKTGGTDLPRLSVEGNTLEREGPRQGWDQTPRETNYKWGTTSTEQQEVQTPPRHREDESPWHLALKTTGFNSWRAGRPWETESLPVKGRHNT